MPTARRKPATAAAAGAASSRAPRASAKRGAKQPVQQDPSGTIVLTGPPARLRATVSVENAVEQRLAIRGLALHREGHDPVAGAAAAVIPPGSTADVPLSVRLDPGTPPGDHLAQIEVGGLRRDVVLRVEPDPSLTVSPRRVLATQGEQPLTLTVSNDGNVAIPLAARQRARTADGGPDPGPDVELVIADPPTVGPGATVRFTATVVVPAGLDPTRRHTARLPLGTADLDVIILPHTATETPS